MTDLGFTSLRDAFDRAPKTAAETYGVVELDCPLLSARNELRDRTDAEMMDGTCPPAWKYLREQGCPIPMHRIAGYTILPIFERGQGLFDFGTEGGPPGFICEVFGDDEETVIDFVAWRLDDPASPLTMFGVCGLIGSASATLPQSALPGAVLTIWRTPLEWLQAGCVGAAVVDPWRASKELLDAHAPLAVQDEDHADALAAAMASTFTRDRFLVPLSGRG